MSAQSQFSCFLYYHYNSGCAESFVDILLAGHQTELFIRSPSTSSSSPFPF